VAVVWQWVLDKEQLDEKLADMKCYQENFEQMQQSIVEIKCERDKVMSAY